MDDEELLKKDSRYKKYHNAMDRSLQSFDTVNEWADVTKFLTNLIKILNSHADFKQIPMKLIVAKRLAQSLNPALPSGVHAKALEAYAILFSNIGKEQLLKDLHLYSFGLFGLMPNTTTIIKPQLIKLFHDYYLPLGINLRPCLKGLIIALIPGLEEDGNEFFDDIFKLVQSLEQVTGSDTFYEAFWLANLVLPRHRLGANNYLAKSFPDIHSRQDFLTFFGANVDLTLSSWAAILTDEKVLVQRGILDLIVQHIVLSKQLLSEQECVFLMGPILSIVLRKETALNRRLYTWLFGKGEITEEQINYFQTYAQQPMLNALKNMFERQSTDLADLTRPYRIVTALMDKAELSGPLVDSLFVTIITSLKQHCSTKSEKESFELLGTAQMFLDVLDPFVIWSKLYRLLDLDLEIVSFFINSARVYDEESQCLHTPYFILLLLSKLNKSPNHFRTEKGAFEALHIVQTLFLGLPQSCIVRLSKPHSTEIQWSGQSFEDTITMIENFYAAPVIANALTMDVYKNAEYVLQSCFLKLAAYAINNLIGKMLRRSCELNSFDQSHSDFLLKLSNFHRSILSKVLVQQNGEVEESKVLVSDSRNRFIIGARVSHVEYFINPPWTGHLLELALHSDKFNMLRTCVEWLLNLHDQLALRLDKVLSNSQLTELVKKLWIFIDPINIHQQTTCTELIWRIQQAAPRELVELVVADLLLSKNDEERLLHYEKFGIFWRISENVQHATVSFSKALFIMLDLLINENPVDRRIGETFLKCSMKSFSRLLDPMLIILLDPSIIRSIKTLSVGDHKEIQLLVYERPFNQDQVNYVLKVLAELFQYGGAPLVRSLSLLPVRNTYILKLAAMHRYGSHKMNDGTSYIELLLLTLNDYCRSEPNEKYTTSALLSNSHSICLAIDFLNLLVTRAAECISSSTLLVMFRSSMQQLVYSISKEKFEIETKLLSLIHSMMPSINRTTEMNLNEHSKPDNFVQIMVESLAAKRNRTVLPYYIDFITSALSFVKPSFLEAYYPILTEMVNQLNEVIIKMDSTSNNFLPVDQELIILLGGIERLILMSDQEGRWELADQPGKSVESLPYGIKGFTDLVTGVFVNDYSVENIPGNAKMREYMLQSFTKVIELCALLWHKLGPEDNQINTKMELLSSQENLSVSEAQPIAKQLQSSAARVKYRLRKLLEVIQRQYPVEYVEIIVDIWSSKHSPYSSQDKSEGRDAVVEMIQIAKTYNHKSLVVALVELLKDQMVPNSLRDRVRRALLILKPRPSGSVLLLFLEYLTDQIYSEETVLDILHLLISLIKEFVIQAASFKHLFLEILRLFTTVLRKLPSNCLDDRKVRKDDLYQKVFDICILIAGRSFDSGLWKKRDSIPDFGQSSVSEIDISNRPQPSDVEVKSTSSNSELPAGTTKSNSKWDRSSENLVIQMLGYLSQVVSYWKLILPEQDRLLSLTSNLVYYVISPNLQKRFSYPYVRFIGPTLDLLIELGKIHGLYKSWRKEVWDIYLEPKFFAMPHAQLTKWRQVVLVILNNDKEKVEEILTRVSSTPAGLFISKEQEAIQKAQALRKLSFLLYCGQYNQLLDVLPSIQEKLVDILKQPPNIAHAEVFFCLRILLLRVPSKKLTNIWPVVITELIHLLLHVTASSDSPDQLAILLQACKFIDLLFVLVLEDFQADQWIFLSELQGDSVRASELMETHALLDRLCLILSKRVSSFSETSIAASSSEKAATDLAHEHLFLKVADNRRRPFFGKDFKTIRSVSELLPFVQAATKWTLDGTLNTARIVMNPFPNTSESRMIVSSSSSVPSIMDNWTKTIDLKFIELAVENDFIEPASSEKRPQHPHSLGSRHLSLNPHPSDASQTLSATEMKSTPTSGHEDDAAPA